jgi:hypothetical protein
MSTPAPKRYIETPQRRPAHVQDAERMKDTPQAVVLRCVNCKETFVHTVADQERFAAQGYRHEPKRCTPCRRAGRGQTITATRPRARVAARADPPDVTVTLTPAEVHHLLAALADFKPPVRASTQYERIIALRRKLKAVALGAHGRS